MTLKQLFNKIERVNETLSEINDISRVVVKFRENYWDIPTDQENNFDYYFETYNQFMKWLKEKYTDNVYIDVVNFNYCTSGTNMVRISVFEDNIITYSISVIRNTNF